MIAGQITPRFRAARMFSSPHAWLIILSWLGLILGGIRDTSAIFYPYRWWFIALMAVGLHGAASRLRAVRYQSEHHWLYVFMAVSAASCAISPTPEYSFARWCTFVIVFVTVFIGAWTWLQRVEHLRLLVNLLLTSAAIGALLSGWYILGSGELIPDTRFAGAFGKATGTGSFAAAAIPIVLWKTRYSRGYAKAFFGLILGILVYLLIFSGARAALIGGTTASLIWVWKHRVSWRPLLAAGIFALVFLAVAGIASLDMLPSYIVRKDSLSTFTGRIPRWKVGLSLFLESPVLGHGYGMTRYVRMYGDEERPRGEIVSASVRFSDLIPFLGTSHLGRMTLHSDHVERLLETGLLGYIPFAMFWFCILRRMFYVFRLPARWASSLAMALALNVGYIFLDSFLHGALFAINAPGVILSWVGIVAFMRASEAALQEPIVTRCTSSTLSTVSIRGPVAPAIP